ncbi:hypothetical protein ACFWF3_34310, partial [Nocardia sp. NPDC060220]|uniref:hypothetical protein n=1 Tax=Nocardia sp. NPDC060220 TaxID=3347076 RepID=UPI0036544819
ASQDVHPWVRRESICRRACAHDETAFHAPIDREVYPGALDLAIAGIEAGVMPVGHEEALDLSAVERNSLRQYILT